MPHLSLRDIRIHQKVQEHGNEGLLRNRLCSESEVHGRARLLRRSQVLTGLKRYQAKMEPRIRQRRNQGRSGEVLQAAAPLKAFGNLIYLKIVSAGEVSNLHTQSARSIQFVDLPPSGDFLALDSKHVFYEIASVDPLFLLFNGLVIENI